MAAGLRFVTLNLVGSSLFLLAAGILYGVTGTLNMADVAQRLPGLGPADATLARAGAWLLLTVFCLKAAILPLYLWLPGVYAAASPPVAALFAVMTKVGIYGVLRVFTMVFGAQAGPLADAAFPWIATVAAAGYALSAIGALAGADLRRLIAFLLIGSAAFLMIGVGLANERSVAAAVYYLPHTTLSAAALWLVADTAARGRGEAGDRLLPGPAGPSPAAVGLLFFVTAVAIAGMPPFGGFIGKAMLLASMLPAQDDGPTPGAATAGLWAIVLGASLLSIVALARAGSTLFWKADPTARPAAGPARLSAGDVLPAGLALAGVVAIAVFAAPMQRYALATARDLLEPSALVDQVLRTVPKASPHQPRPESLR
jgi:multicomponent K+:H+ antiporter subunit D